MGGDKKSRGWDDAFMKSTNAKQLAMALRQQRWEMRLEEDKRRNESWQATARRTLGFVFCQRGHGMQAVADVKSGLIKLRCGCARKVPVLSEPDWPRARRSAKRNPQAEVNDADS